MVPPLPTPLLGMRLLRSPGGNQVLFVEEPATISITTASMEQTVILSPTGIQLIAGTNVISMNESGITIAGETVTLTGVAEVRVNAPAVSVVGAAKTSVGGGGPTLITGAPISIG
jgi:hypothetical protein